MTGPHSAPRQVVPFPGGGEVFFDPRPGRAMRLSWHVDEGVAVVSLWQGASCAGTFRLPISEVPDLVDALVRGLALSASATATSA
ncbi:MAG TPA: hypothetical protein VEY14_06130 [Nocardioidaceae bacterium]|nr:hypothetical protein [Nocardioidaceae bacterium]